ncbi:hypothetical protein CNMCM5793_000467 [Aspergillus hiratsukae]|uniref:Uncharacterized protein n=1 Tax=Aspergillus hiratsukae TaxID=1194566 RepID=A0A8H6UDW6_9EURO|nr:hypothetical protein CNMCM5793_000467 [Aspergillus hiratsukae]KAF7162069.1 hypothetical protein CNMCM6106_009103 [Aspergillus hiratsukae]
MNSVQAILEAATVLSKIEDADRQDLLSHRHELESAFAKLQALLQPVSPRATSPSTTLETLSGSDACAALERSQTLAASPRPPIAVVPAVPAVPTASNASPGTPRPGDISLSPASAAPDASSESPSPGSHDQDDAGENQFPGPVQELMKSLTRHEGEILTYFHQQPESAVFAGKDSTSEDPRIVYISQLEKKKATPDAKFRSGLSALSLEHDYTEWERSHRKARVDSLPEDLNSATSRRAAAFKEYVDICSDRFQDKAKARRHIEYGVKFTVFGKIYSALAKEGRGKPLIFFFFLVLNALLLHLVIMVYAPGSSHKKYMNCARTN